MKRLETLRRVREQWVDECRLALAQIDARRESVADHLDHLRTQILCEQEMVAGDPSWQSAYASFAARAVEKREFLEQQLGEIECTREQAAETLRVGFADLKSVEIAIEAQARLSKKHRDRREQIKLDETGSLTWNVRRGSTPSNG